MANAYHSSVFINCPFDDEYEPILRAICFTIMACGFRPRCALDFNNGADVRIQIIAKMMGECGLGIHDLSRVPDAVGELPRMNMPFELGLYLGAKYFGNEQQKRSKILILDSEPHRYDVTISDISGQDPSIHNDDPEEAIVMVRNWLAANRDRRRPILPGGGALVGDYQDFMRDIEDIARPLRLDPANLTHGDFLAVVYHWLENA